MIIYGVYSYQNNSLSNEVSKLNHESTTLLTEKKSLDQKLIAHKPSPAKIAAISRLKEDVKTKQDSLNVINSFDDEKLEGYSGVMSSLANLNRNDISLNSIQIDDNKLNVQGYARNPEVVPSWVGQFKDELSLVGRTFEHLSIGRDDKDNVIFSLRSKSGNQK
ncbi:msha biogenesis protein mshi [Vibrio sp. S17_S38]|nr:msha biogenesis protein mshi [Vibrio sp. S17_S38]